MKSVSIKFLSVLIVILSVISCSSFEKRKYRSGYHIEWREKSVFKTNKKGNKVNNLKEVVYSTIKDVPELEIVNSSPKRIKKVEKKLAKEGLELDVKEERFLKEEKQAILTKSYKFSSKKKSDLKQRESNEVDWMGAGLLASVLSAGFLTISSRRKLKKVSKWAKENKNKARFILAGSSTLISALSFSTGWLAETSDYNAAKFALFSAGAIGTGVSYYGKKGKRTYGFRKIREFIFAGLLMGVFHIGGNELKQDFKEREEIVQVSDAHQSSFYHQVVNEIDEDLALGLRIFGKVILTVLLLVACIYLLMVIAALSCTLACNGIMSGAVALAIFGGAGVLVLFGFGFYHIWKKWKKSKNEKSINDKKPKKDTHVFWENFLIGVFAVIGLALAYISLGI